MQSGLGAQVNQIYRRLPGDLRLRSRIAILVCYCNIYRRLFDICGGGEV
jgi:hypothetical protein